MTHSPDHPALCLQLSHHQTSQGLNYQLLSIELTRSDRLIEPQNLIDLELPPGINPTNGVVISGRAPIWLYAYLVHECHPTSWVACYDPRLGAVVVATHTLQVKIGQVIPVAVANERPHSQDQGQKEEKTGLCPALMIVGPPDSGKSVFSHTLFKALLPTHPDIYLQRAHWDGEGNYVLELGPEATKSEIEAFKARNRGNLTERFFPYHAEAILNLRRQKSLVIVDVGGMVQPEKLPILEACTHYLIISSNQEEVPRWHEFCQYRGNLKPVAVIFSVLAELEIIHSWEPYLQITCGPWIAGQTRSVPEVLMDKVRSLLRQPPPLG